MFFSSSRFKEGVSFKDLIEFIFKNAGYSDWYDERHYFTLTRRPKLLVAFNLSGLVKEAFDKYWTYWYSHVQKKNAEAWQNCRTPERLKIVIGFKKCQSTPGKTMVGGFIR